jgi:hypothetical protein
MKSVPSSSRQKACASPYLEPLESRQLLSAGVAGHHVSHFGQALVQTTRTAPFAPVQLPVQPVVTPLPADTESPGEIQVVRLIQSSPAGLYTPTSKIAMGTL